MNLDEIRCRGLEISLVSKDLSRVFMNCSIGHKEVGLSEISASSTQIK